MAQLNEQQRSQLDEFLRQQQARAFKMAWVMTHNRDDALELVQDSMARLVQHYADKPTEQWPLLFHRILHNRARDFHRRKATRRLFSWFGPAGDEAEHAQQPLNDGDGNNPYRQLEHNEELARIVVAIRSLPLRQQQVFLLRAWQEFSVNETAATMSLSPGSVKSHYSRALDSLREKLGDSNAKA